MAEVLQEEWFDPCHWLLGPGLLDAKAGTVVRHLRNSLDSRSHNNRLAQNSFWKSI
jgi:hypothetical protein